jgi:predicted nucleotidyltransferase
MRYTQPLDDLLSSQARLRVLRYLCTVGGEHSGREIARAIGMGETPTNRALKALADTLVVLYRVAGRAHFYRVNEGHTLVKQVLRPLFAAEEGLQDTAIAELVTGLDMPLDTVLVYGSVARGEDSWHSDLDVLIITPTTDDARQVEEHIWQRDDDLLRRYGVISVRTLSRVELQQGAQGGEKWLMEALREGVVVKGTHPQLLLREQIGEKLGFQAP